MAKVSIGLPVYNGANYLRTALDSLLAQTHADFELIISDNASTDGTAAVCAEYAARDSRVSYFRQPGNIGAYRNFLAVLSLASSPLFMWAAADDWWDPGWLAALLNQMRNGVAISFGSVVPFIDPDRIGPGFALKSLRGPGIIRLVRYFMWRESGPKACPIYGLFRTEEIRAMAEPILARRGAAQWAADDILVFSMLNTGSLRVDPGVSLYKRIGMSQRTETRNTHLSNALVSAAKGIIDLSRDRWVPYLIAHVRYSHGIAYRLVIACVAPLKYVYLAMSFLTRGIFARIRSAGFPLPGSPRPTWGAQLTRLYIERSARR